MTKIELSASVLKKLFQNVYFIHGTAYAGKSAMVKLLAEKYHGICCGENYIDPYLPLLNPDEHPNLCYFQTMASWQEFVSRSPEQYEAWLRGCAVEGTELEIMELLRCCQENKSIFVDTNIPLSLLHQISDYHHVAVMTAAPSVSVSRFFEREDREKQFLYRQILASNEPEKTMKNFRACLQRINSEENRAAFENSGFFVLRRDDTRTPQETLQIIERHFQLG